MKSDLVTRHLEQLAGLLPCWMAAFDLADTKRRNLHLGWQSVDQELKEFADVLDAGLPKNSLIVRVGGDKWVAFLKEDGLPCLDDVIAKWERRTTIKAGLWCKGVSAAGERRVTEASAEVIIMRAVRCGVRFVDQVQGLSAFVQESFGRLAIVSVNEVSSLNYDLVPGRLPWCCVEGNVPSEEICPFCSGTAFDWIEGTSSGSYGTCERCHAEVDFEYF